MKFLFFLMLTFFLFSCSSTNEELNSESSTKDPVKNEELIEYKLKDCIDYVMFNESNKYFLNFLISKGYDLNNDFKISCNEALLVTELDLGDSGYVNDLKGIESLKNLKKLSGFINTDVINLYNNNSIEELNLNKKKTTVTTGGINTAELTLIRKLILPNNSSLKILNCNYTNLFQILNTEKQSNLEYIYLNDTRLEGELDFSNSNKLKEVDLNNNYGITLIKFSNINNPNLISLKIGTKINVANNNGLSKISVNTFPNLQSLDVSNNSLLDVNLTENKQLLNLEINRNQIKSLNLVNNELLKSLNARNNTILNLDVKKLINLNVLTLGYNKISKIDLSNSTKLWNLEMNNNLLENIDLSNNSNLGYVNLNENDLIYINLKNGKNSKLQRLNTKQNKIDCISIDKGFIPDDTKWLKDSNTKYCY